MAVVYFGGDLFFASRVEAAARRLGQPFAACRSAGELGAALARCGPDARAAVVLLDLSGDADPATVVPTVRAAGARRVVAFGPHRDTAARARALAAGCDEWLPNSRLAAELPRLLAV